MQSSGPGGASPGAAPEWKESAVCAAVAARLDGLVVGDLPPAMARELAPHLATCGSCSADVAAFRRLAADLRALPVTASPARSWAAIQWAIAVERREQPLPWAAQVSVLAAAGLVVAAALVRSSGAIADRLAAFSASRLPSGLADALAASPSLRPFVLPGLFMLFGAVAALVAWPLLAPTGRTMKFGNVGNVGNVART